MQEIFFDPQIVNWPVCSQENLENLGATKMKDLPGKKWKTLLQKYYEAAAAAVNVLVMDRQHLRVKRLRLNALIPPDVGHGPCGPWEIRGEGFFFSEQKHKTGGGATVDVAHKQTNKSNRGRLIQHNPISIQSALRVKTLAHVTHRCSAN